MLRKQHSFNCLLACLLARTRYLASVPGYPRFLFIVNSVILEAAKRHMLSVCIRHIAQRFNKLCSGRMATRQKSSLVALPLHSAGVERARNGHTPKIRLSSPSSILNQIAPNLSCIFLSSSRLPSSAPVASCGNSGQKGEHCSHGPSSAFPPSYRS